jgi:PAS domain S-box-containing protein
MSEMPTPTGVDRDKKEEFRETSLIFESIIRESPLAIDVIDREGKVIIWNPAAERLFGWTKEEALGKPLANIPDETRRLVEIISEVTLEGEAFTGIETVMRRNDGQIINVALSTAPFYGGHEEILGIMTVYVDISAQKRAEEILEFLSRAGAELIKSLEVIPILESLARLALPVLADFVAIDLVEDDGTVERMATKHIDPAGAEVAEKLRSYAPAEYHFLNGREARDEQPEILAEVSDSWLVRRAQNAEHLRLMRRLAPNSIMIVPIHVRDRVFGSITFALTKPGRRYGLRDLQLALELAQRAAIAIENAELYEEVRQAVQARDDVLAVVSPDLRNPINTISMTAELILEEMPAEERTRMVEIIQRSTERMERLIRDLLDVARIEAGGFTLNPTEQDPGTIAPEAVELQRLLAEDKSIALTAEIPGPLPMIRADRERLLQVLQNLIENALKFTPDNGKITLCAVPAPGGVYFSVQDTGEGIEPEELEHLFDRFWQAGRTTRSGAGLGLAIARGIVEAHGGRIWAESTPGTGTTVSFMVPARGPEGEEAS